MKLDIEKAVIVYYSTFFLNTADICDLMGCAHVKAGELKRKVQDFQIQRGEKLYDARTCGTRALFDFLGYDIADIEMRYAKLKKYKKDTGGQQKPQNQ